MGSVAMSGNDSVTLNNRIFNDLADGDFASLSFPNEIASVKTGKNGNSIYALNESGKQADFVMRLIRGSADDKYLNGLLTAQSANFAGFALLQGEFVKQIGDGSGKVSRDTYIVSGGVFTKRVEGKGNAEGNTDQSIAEYHFKFANAPRTIT